MYVAALRGSVVTTSSVFVAETKSYVNTPTSGALLVIVSTNSKTKAGHAIDVIDEVTIELAPVSVQDSCLVA